MILIKGRVCITAVYIIRGRVYNRQFIWQASYITEKVYNRWSVRRFIFLHSETYTFLIKLYLRDVHFSFIWNLGLHLMWLLWLATTIIGLYVWKKKEFTTWQWTLLCVGIYQWPLNCPSWLGSFVDKPQILNAC